MLTIRLLGEMAVLRSGEPLPLPPSKKTRALLAYLVAIGRPQRRERLCSLLWELPDDPRGALRWSLSKLRALVDEPGGEARIRADRETVTFAVERVECDLRALRDIIARPLDAVPLDRLLAVADSIDGEFLEGLDLPAQSDFQAWCLAEREDARRHHAAVLSTLVARLSSGVPEEVLPHARRLVGLDPFDGRARAALVDLLARAGRREEAEQQCEIGLRVLRDAGMPAGDLAKSARTLRTATVSGRAAVARAAEANVPPGTPSGAPLGAPADTILNRAQGGGEDIKQLVVVDDEPELGQVVAEYLARHGFAVRTATGGGGLDALLAAAPADLVILDVNLPGEDGFAIARRLRVRGGPPILFLTADDAVVDRVVGLELGAEDYITKPFDLRELRARIRVVLRRMDASQATAEPRYPGVGPPLGGLSEGTPGASARTAPDSASQGAPEGGIEPIETAASAPPAERKQVTVLVAALAEAEAGENGLDPELSMRRLDPCLEVIRDAVHRYDGSITAMQSDGIAAVFGAPVAHEDDAVTACLAALAMRDALRGGGFPGVVLRVGLHSGEVVVRPAGGRDHPTGIEAVGPAVRMASQVATRATPGGVALTAETVRRAEGFVNVAPLGDEVPPGQGAVRLYSLSGRAAPRSRWDVRAARGLTRFLGRDTELEGLRRALRRAATGHGEVVAIVGEPGVGKSRLVHEFLDAVVPPDWAVLATGATPHNAGAAYLPIGGLLRSWLGVVGSETQHEVAAKLLDRIEVRHPALRPHQPALSSLLDLPVEDEAWRTLSPGQRPRARRDAIRAVLAWESQRQPLVVLFEDLHWADPQTAAALDALVEGLGALRMLIVVTHRPEHRHGWAGKGCFSQLRLDPLPADAVEALLRSLLGDDAGLDLLRRSLAARTGGIPLFLEEVVWALAESGALSGAPGGYRLTTSVVGLDLPATIQAVLAARIDRLPPRAKALLQTAAVIGREVPILLLRRVAGLADAALRDALAELQAAEFLFETHMPPDLEYAFKHALTQEVAYGGVLRDRRRTLHVDLVRAIEECHSERLAEQVDRLAHHAEAGELWEEAVRYLLQAANRAIERSAHRQAAELLNRGLLAMERLPETSQRLRVELDYQKAMGVTMMATKGWGAQEVSDAYTRARALCDRLGDERELFAVLRGQGQFHMIRGELRTARALGERCIALATAHGNDAGVAIESHHLFWSNSFFMGDYAEAEAHARHGIETYDRGRDHRLTYLYSGHDPGVCCRCFSGLVLWQQGYADQALARCREALALAEQIGHPLTLALAYWAMSYVHLFRREPAEAQSWAEREIAVCEEYQLPLLLSQGAFQLGWALAEQGAPEAGIERMREGLAGVSATGAEMGLPYFIALLGEAHAKAGRPEEGLAEIERALATAEQNGARFQVPEILRLKGELLRRLPEPDEAAAEMCFREAVAAAQAQGARLPELRAAASLARLPRSRRDGAATREALAATYGGLTEGFDTFDLQEARALLDA